MAENIKTKFDDLQELIRLCDNVEGCLNNFHYQLIKIIEVKKKSSASASDNVVFDQAVDFSAAVANLEKIDSRVLSAISKMKQLTQQAALVSSVSNARVVKQKDSGGKE